MMPTNTFDKKFVISDIKSVRKILEMEKIPPKRPLSEHPFDSTARAKSERLIEECIARSRRSMDSSESR